MSSALNDEGPASFRELVAEEVRAHLARRRLSGRELSRRLGEAATWASRRLSGDVAMDTDDLERIASVLGMSPQALLAGVYDTPAARRDAPHRLVNNESNKAICSTIYRPTSTPGLDRSRRHLRLVPSPEQHQPPSIGAASQTAQAGSPDCPNAVSATRVKAAV